jgi:DNA-binding PadR family transcriptional regulator
MDQKLRKIYVPMSETAFYILFSLQKPQHGYGIGLDVQKITNNEVSISPGTMYGTLSKMEKDGLIKLLREEEKRKIYQTTDLGKEILQIELNRIKRLYKNSIGEEYYG